MTLTSLEATILHELQMHAGIGHLAGLVTAVAEDYGAAAPFDTPEKMRLAQRAETHVKGMLFHMLRDGLVQMSGGDKSAYVITAKGRNAWAAHDYLAEASS